MLHEANALWARWSYLVVFTCIQYSVQQVFAAVPPYCRRWNGEDFRLLSQFPEFLEALEVRVERGSWVSKSELAFQSEKEKNFKRRKKKLCTKTIIHIMSSQICQSCSFQQSDNNLFKSRHLLIFTAAIPWWLSLFCFIPSIENCKSETRVSLSVLC